MCCARAGRYACRLASKPPQHCMPWGGKRQRHTPACWLPALSGRPPSPPAVRGRHASPAPAASDEAPGANQVSRHWGSAHMRDCPDASQAAQLLLSQRTTQHLAGPCTRTWSRGAAQPSHPAVVLTTGGVSRSGENSSGSSSHSPLRAPAPKPAGWPLLLLLEAPPRGCQLLLLEEGASHWRGCSEGNRAGGERVRRDGGWEGWRGEEQLQGPRAVGSKTSSASAPDHLAHYRRVNTLPLGLHACWDLGKPPGASRQQLVVPPEPGRRRRTHLCVLGAHLRTAHKCSHPALAPWQPAGKCRVQDGQLRSDMGRERVVEGWPAPCRHAQRHGTQCMVRQRGWSQTVGPGRIAGMAGPHLPVLCAWTALAATHMADASVAMVRGGLGSASGRGGVLGARCGALLAPAALLVDSAVSRQLGAGPSARPNLPAAQHAAWAWRLLQAAGRHSPVNSRSAWTAAREAPARAPAPAAGCA